MAIVNEDTKVKVSGDGSTREFSFGFKIYQKSDLTVYLIDKDTEEIDEKTLTTDYKVSIDTTGEGGTVEFVTLNPPSSDEWVFMFSALDYTQNVVLPTDGAFREKKVSDGLDRLCRLIQQVKGETSRSIKLPVYADESEEIVFPPLSSGFLYSDGSSLSFETTEGGVLAAGTGIDITDDQISVDLTSDEFSLGGDLDAGSNKITSLADGVDSGDAVNKGQLDNASGDSTHLAQDMQELTDDANISWDMDSGGFAYVTLEGNRTLDNPTNVSAGGMYRLKIIQSGGDRTLSFGSNFKFPGNQEPVLSSGDGDVDLLEFIAYSSTELYLTNAIFDIQ